MFEPPDGFDSLAFWSMGIVDKPQLPFVGSRNFLPAGEMVSHDTRDDFP